MKPLIETAHLEMREFAECDAQAVFTLCSNEEVTRYTGDSGTVQSSEDAAWVIKNVWLKEYRENGYGRYAVVEKQSGQVIGFCGFKFNKELDAPDIGYQLMPEYWGKGFGTELVAASLVYGRDVLKLTRAFAEVAVENTASHKILQKHGFSFVKRFDKDGMPNHLYVYEF